MFTTDRHIKTSLLTNLTDYSSKCPEGMRSFYAYVSFTDQSQILLDRIFAADRGKALAMLMTRFADCGDYIQGISLYSDEG